MFDPDQSHTTAHQRLDLYKLWKAEGPHLAEYACEFLGTAILVFAVVGWVALMFSPTSPMPAILPSKYARLFCAGFLIGSTGSLFTVSAAGRLSGAHLNPAVSLGFWTLGKMHPRDLGGYVAAQLIGGIAGAVLAAHAFGGAGRDVKEALLIPPGGLSVAACFWSELAATLAYCYGIYACVSHTRTMRWTPVLNIALAATIVCLDGAVSGAGLNPARWIGPAAVMHVWRYGWLYTLAPCAAGLLAAAFRLLLPVLGHQTPHTGKLFHDPAFRSIFKDDKAPSAAPEPPA